MAWYFYFLVAVYIVGIIVAFNLLGDKRNMFEKVVFSLFWPLPALLYCIHWLHMRL